MITENQKEKARIFSRMHKENKMFLLPNAWNVGSAYIYEKQGFKAVATSSAGIAYDLGYPDGEDISFDDLLWIVQKISTRLDIPLSVDFERGYAKTAQGVKDKARKLLLAGAVGFNIEDGLPEGTLASLESQIEKISALSELKKEMEIDFVINARTCSYWLNVADEKNKLEIALKRGNAFAQAGADCIFIPGPITQSVAAKLVAGIKSPINLILNSAFNDFAELEKLGVRRLSLGSAPVRNIYKKTIDMAASLFNGDTSALLNNTFAYEKANIYFKK